MLNSFEPIINNTCKILILGTMPGVQSIDKQEYYGNERNSFWRIIYSLFNNELSKNYLDKKAFLLKNNIALWDVLKFCYREGSSDSNIKNPIPNDFGYLFGEYPNIKTVFFNGEPAEKLFKRLVMKDIEHLGFSFYRLPSTSPANTTRFEQKLDLWKKVLFELDKL